VGSFAGGRFADQNAARTVIVAVPRGGLAGPGGRLASSLPASAANVGIALGAYAGGVAIGTFTASSAVITGLIIAVISIPVAWAASS
jgi:predicted MFS family arabinose efflux permease